MKKSNIAVLITLVVAALYVVGYDRGKADAQATMGPAKVGIVNINLILQTSKKHKQWQEQMGVEEQKVQAEFDKINSELRILDADIKTRTPGSPDYVKLVREYEEETNYRGYLFLDASRSMDYGQGATHKFTYAKILCATLALLMKSQNDAPGLVLLGNPPDQPERFIAPSTRADHLDRLLLRLQEMKSDGECDNLGDVLPQLENCVTRSLSVIVSDGFFRLHHPIEIGFGACHRASD